jgi:hypothetical protein
MPVMLALVVFQQRVWLKDEANPNIDPMFVTDDTDHKEMSLLKAKE